MSAHRRSNAMLSRRSVLLVAIWLALPLAVAAQSAPATAASAPTMPMGAMPGMTMPAASSSTGVAKSVDTRPAAAKRGKKKHAAAPASTAPGGMSGMSGMSGMPGMAHVGMHPAPASSSSNASSASTESMSGMRPNRSGMDHGAMPPAAPHGGNVVPDMRMGPMQGGGPPPGARSPDYSDGIGYGPMRGMDMRDDAPQSMLLVDQLEAFHGRQANGQTWEAEGWYGNDDDKLWLRTEGERSRDRLDDGDVELLWNHTVATYWSSQLGLRQDLGQGPDRHWAAFGVQGLSPYWFELEATGYVGDGGRTAARFRAEYEVLFTQRLILQPEFEINAYGQSDAQRRIGGGLSDAELGLRLRYEFSRRFAPYAGVLWMRRFGGTADFVRDDHQAIFDRQWVAGIRFWF